jgi:hypothetical protein
MTDRQLSLELEKKRGWRTEQAQFIRRIRQVSDQYSGCVSEKARDSGIIVGICLLLVFLILLSASICHAECISEEKGVQCILGEARGEGFESMKSHAEAIRNRGNLKGVYGCRVDLSKEMAYLKKTGIYDLAVKAWHESKTSNIVKGASFWGSLKVDGKWIKKMERNGYVKTVVIRNTVFYRN